MSSGSENARSAVRDWLLGQPRELRVPLAKPSMLKVGDDGAVVQKTGVCCSGGGIRSAAFCLGALQLLNERGELKKETVVSAVSGGSYIASSFVAVKNKSPNDTFGDDDPKIYAPGSPEEQHLRNHSTYMAPGGGGIVRLLVRVLLGMVVNLFVIGCTLAVIAIPLALAYDRIYDLGDLSLEPGILGRVPSLLWLFVGVPIAVGILLAGSDLTWRIRNDDRRLFFEAWSYRGLWTGSVIAIVLIALPMLLIWASTFQIDPGIFSFFGNPDNLESLAALGAGSIVVAILGALRTVVARRPTLFAMAAGAIAAPVLVLTTLILVMQWVLDDDGSGFFDFNACWALAIGAALALAWIWADLTQWSLHPFYRRRLSSAFFTERVRLDDNTLAIDEIGFKKPLFMTDLEDDPFHLVVCAAANVSTHGVVPPGRSATPFTFTRNRIGAPLLDDLVTRDLPIDREKAQQGDFGERASKDFTLPAAVAVSGAAIAPSMGKKTKRALTMLMALLNVRLGVWIGNPRRANDLHKSRFWFMRGEGPVDRDLLRKRPTPIYLLKEMLGLSDINDQFLYVSDGGHYDNLGLIELLRRGCTTIYCLDGGGDPMGTYRALGEAVALARSDLQVEVDLHPEPVMIPDKDSRIAAQNHVMGTVSYRVEGRPKAPYLANIVYTRATLTDDAPEDVLAYKEKTRKFPYHSTLDQLFDDQKFEAYRALGYHCGRHASEAMNATLGERLDPRPEEEHRSSLLGKVLNPKR